MPKFSWSKINKKDWGHFARSNGHSASSLSQTSQSHDIFAAEDKHKPHVDPRVSIFINKSSDNLDTPKKSAHPSQSAASLKTTDKDRSLHPRRQAIGSSALKATASKVSSFKIRDGPAAHRKPSYNSSFDASIIKR